MSKKQLVLLGVGHTNAHIVKEWKTAPITDVDLVCVSEFPTAAYSGMLPGAMGGQFDDDEWRIDLSRLCRRASARLILAETIGLDLQAGELHFNDHPSLRFDVLSIGVGSIPAGCQEHADAPSIVPIKPMQTLMQRLDLRMREISADERRPLKVAIVGGGVAGVEIAFCLQRRFVRQSLSSEVSVGIYTSDEHAAVGMSAKGIRCVERLLSVRSIHVARGHRVSKVREGEIETDDGRRHRADIVIWATGAAAPPVLGKLGLTVDDRGFIATSNTLQSLTDSRIFAVGDSGTVIESPSPKAGVYAVRQCPILSHNLRAIFANQPMRAFRPQSSFMKIINTGDGKALLEYGRLIAHARWCWNLKKYINKRFIRAFQVG